MNTSIKTTLAAVALTAAFAGPAAAISGQSISGAVHSAVTDGNVNVFVEDGVATLSGWVDNDQTANAAKRAALSFDNVDSVVDMIILSH